MRLYCFLVMILFLCACSNEQQGTDPDVPYMHYVLETSNWEQTEREAEVSRMIGDDFVKSWNKNVKPAYSIGGYTVFSRGPMTIEQFDYEMGITEENFDKVVEKRRNDLLCQQVIYLRESYTQGDEIFFFSSGREQSWLRAGYALVRENKIIAVVIVALS